MSAVACPSRENHIKRYENSDVIIFLVVADQTPDDDVIILTLQVDHYRSWSTVKRISGAEQEHSLSKSQI